MSVIPRPWFTGSKPSWSALERDQKGRLSDNARQSARLWSRRTGPNVLSTYPGTSDGCTPALPQKADLKLVQDWKPEIANNAMKSHAGCCGNEVQRCDSVVWSGGCFPSHISPLSGPDAGCHQRENFIFIADSVTADRGWGGWGGGLINLTNAASDRMRDKQ